MKLFILADDYSKNKENFSNEIEKIIDDYSF
jgi:hypothetical protein